MKQTLGVGAVSGLFPVTAVLLAILPSVLVAQDADAVDFGRDVYPMIERSCVSCHRAEFKDANGRTKRPKGGLRLDGKLGFTNGAKGEAILKPGKASESLLVTVVTLPPDHDDFMPAKGDPLTASEVATLRRWVDSGADFGGWVGVDTVAASDPKNAAVAVASRVALIERLGASLTPLSAAVIRGAIGDLGAATEAQPGSPLLRVQFVSNESKVTDSVIKRLRPVASHVTSLDLSGTKVTDAAMETLVLMTRLTRLNLNHTEISDRGIAKLSKLPELRVLNLYGTDVGDKSLDALSGLKSLETLYVWKTHVTQEGAARLSAARPGLEIKHRLELPVVTPEDGAPRNRRRAKKNN